MNETYIQTIRGGIQHVTHLAKDHWTQTPKPCGFYYHHEHYGYIPVPKPAALIRDDWNETHMGREEYAWLCYENHWPTIEQMAEKRMRKLLRIHGSAVRNGRDEIRNRTVARVVIDVDGIEGER